MEVYFDVSLIRIKFLFVLHQLSEYAIIFHVFFLFCYILYRIFTSKHGKYTISVANGGTDIVTKDL